MNGEMSIVFFFFFSQPHFGVPIMAKPTFKHFVRCFQPNPASKLVGFQQLVFDDLLTYFPIFFS